MATIVVRVLKCYLIEDNISLLESLTTVITKLTKEK